MSPCCAATRSTARLDSKDCTSSVMELFVGIVDGFVRDVCPGDGGIVFHVLDEIYSGR
jgi:hypothetical protein